MQIHPMIVHFPIALIISGFLFYILSFLEKRHFKGRYPLLRCVNEIGLSLLTLGAVSAIAAIGAGFLFTMPMIGWMGEIRQMHILFALLATLGAIVTVVLWYFSLQNSSHAPLFFYVTGICYLISVVLIGYTGHLGGQMVFGF